MAVEKLYQLSRNLHQQAFNVESLLPTAVKGACAVFDAPHGCLVRYDAQGTLIDFCASGTQLDPKIERELWKRLIQNGFVGAVAERWRPVTVPDITAERAWPKLERYPSLRWRGAAAAVPLIEDGQLLGVLALIHPQPGFFGEAEMAMMFETADVISAALRNATVYETMNADYVQLRRNNEIEQETDQLRHDLTAMIYHDLRAPLHNVHASLGTLELMLHSDNPALVERLLKIAMQGSRRLIRMVKSLLDIDRLEAGRAVLHKKPTRFSAIFADMDGAVRPLAEENDQTLIIDCEDTVPGVVVDHDMILRVIINLVENAIKHTPSGGQITIGAHDRGGEVLISVSDTGPGIPETHREDVFDKYFRIRNTDQTRLEEMKIGVPTQETPDVSTRGGVGLGLAFCRLAIEAHGGRIWVEDAPGGGAMFAFALPTEGVLEPMMEMN